MKSKELEEEIINIILNTIYYLHKEDIQEDSKLLKDLGVDDLDFVVILMKLENHFNISITGEECYKITTVGQIFNLINSKIN